MNTSSILEELSNVEQEDYNQDQKIEAKMKLMRDFMDVKSVVTPLLEYNQETMIYKDEDHVVNREEALQTVLT